MVTDKASVEQLRLQQSVCLPQDGGEVSGAAGWGKEHSHTFHWFSLGVCEGRCDNDTSISGTSSSLKYHLYLLKAGHASQLQAPLILHD